VEIDRPMETVMDAPADSKVASDAFDVARAELDRRRRDDAEQSAARRAMWLAHHWPDHYDRCVHVAGRPVCRRCLWLYPLTVAVALAALADVLLWPRSLDPLLIWTVCIPGTLEFVGEQLGRLRYSARRQVLATISVALPLGRGLSYEFASRWSWEFWGPLLTYGSIWFTAAAVGHRRYGRPATAT
jgi:hypothetical protein